MSVRVLLVTLIVLLAANLGIEILDTVPDAGRIGMAGRWRNVWVLDEYGQRLYRVNVRLVAAGYANIYSGIPFEYGDEYLEYERAAREEERGLWGGEYPGSMVF